LKRFVLKLFLFLLPFIGALVVENFNLPIDFFTFRVWEAVVVRQLKGFLPGPFYPNMRIKKVEQGDLAHTSAYAIEKKVEWVTDRFGYRRENRKDSQFDIVIVGQSSVVGSALTQEDMLSEKLERKLGVDIYPYAPSDLNKFLKDDRFKIYPPKTVVLCVIEKYMLKDKMDIMELKSQKKLWESLFPFFVRLDRILKFTLVRFVHARMKTSVDLKFRMFKKGEDHMFFMAGPKALISIDRERVDQAADVMAAYKKIFKKRGMDFIVVPIPYKETIYFDYFRGQERPTFLHEFEQSLTDRGVKNVNLQRVFEDFKETDSRLLYHIDDVHWNRIGTGLAAQALMDVIEAL